MFAKTKGVLIVICVLVFALALMAGRSNMPSRPRPVPRPDGAVELTPVLVEAFVVEVRLPALADLRVGPMGQEPHAVSVADILKCLDNGQARVVAGAKAASQGDGPTKVTEGKTVYVKRQAGPQAPVDYNAYESGKRFSASASVGPDSLLSVQYNFSHDIPMQKVPAAKVPSGADELGMVRFGCPASRVCPRLLPPSRTTRQRSSCS